MNPRPDAAIFLTADLPAGLAAGRDVTDSAAPPVEAPAPEDMSAAAPELDFVPAAPVDGGKAPSRRRAVWIAVLVSAALHAAAFAFVAETLKREGVEAATDAVSVEIVLDGPLLHPAQPLAGTDFDSAEAAVSEPVAAEAQIMTASNDAVRQKPSTAERLAPTSDNAALLPSNTTDALKPVTDTAAVAPAAEARPAKVEEHAVALESTANDAPTARKPADEPVARAAPDRQSPTDAAPEAAAPVSDTARAAPQADNGAEPVLSAPVQSEVAAPVEPQKAEASADVAPAESASPLASAPAPTAATVADADTVSGVEVSDVAEDEAGPALPRTDAPLPTPRPSDQPPATVAARPEPKSAHGRPPKPAQAGSPARDSRTQTNRKPAQPPSAASAAGRQGGATAGEKASYARKLLAHVQRHKRYPPGTDRLSGATKLAITIDRGGGFAGARVLSGSGHAVLDQAALAVARNAAPYPKPPEGVGGATFTFAVTLRYRR